MRKSLLAFIALCLCGVVNVHAQLTGTKNIPGDYATLALAITDLNTQGVGAGGVTINLVAGNPQTAPAGGYSITTNTGTAANQIIIQGNANTITASGALTVGAINDGIFKIIGSDYVTIRNFVMQENPANTVSTPTASNNMTEFGVALFYATATNGAKNNSIIDNTITLNRAYANTFGVYSNTRHTASSMTVTADVTSAGGSNSNNSVYSNNISNVNFGVTFIGSGVGANQDQGNIVGSATVGNTFTNWGGNPAASAYVSSTSTSYCIMMNHQVNSTVRGNNITTTATPAVTFRAILLTYTTASPTIGNTNRICQNTITISSGQTAGTMQVIGIASGSNSEMAILDSNLIQNCAVTGASSATTLTAINVAGALGGLMVRYNRVFNCTSAATTGGFVGINITSAMGGNCDVNNNSIGNASNNAITFSAATSGAVAGISFTGSGGGGVGVGLNDNTFHGFNFAVTASSVVNIVQQTGTVGFSFVNLNNFDNIALNTTGQINLINNDMVGTGTSSASVTGNFITGSLSKTVAGGGTLVLVSGTGASAAGASRAVQNNIFANVNTVNSDITGINEIGGAVVNSMNRVVTGNTMSGWNTAGAAYGIVIRNAGNNSTISTNTMTAIASTGTFTGIWLDGTNGGSPTIFTNNISAIASFGAVQGLVISGFPTFTLLEIANNNFNNLGSSNPAGSTLGYSLASGGAINMHNNTVFTIACDGGIADNTAAIKAVLNGSASSIHDNKIFDISNTNAAGDADGMIILNASTLDIYNNYIGDIRAASSGSSLAVCGLTISGGTTVDASYNTIHLNASSGVGNFGSACLYVSTTPTFTSRNNLLVNLSTASGAGLTTAYQRSGTSLATYTAASNNNAYYAGIPSAANLIFHDGTNSDQTLAQFQTRVGPSSDALSVTENTIFSSTNGPDPDYLHIAAATPSLMESGGTVIATITTDWDTDTRPGPVGSVNGGALAPDIGADEFDGILTTCSGAPTAGTANVAIPAQCPGSTFDLSLSGHSTGLSFTYQWQESSNAGGPYSNIVGATADTYTTTPLATTMYYVCVVTCTVSGMSSTSTEVTATVYPAPVLSFAPANPSLCAGGSPVNVVVSGANTYVWSPATGLSSSTINNPDANPASTTTYTVVGTSTDGCTGSETVTVTVNPLPTLTLTATPPSVCIGSSTTMTASGADTYIWAPLFVSGSSVTDAPAATTTYTVTGTDALGCTNTETITVTVNPIPTVTASADFTTVCAGDPVTLTGGGASTYVWDPGAIASNPAVVNPVSTTTYTVTGTDGNGCTNTETITITVNPLPSISATATPPLICAGENVQLDASGAITYLWMPGSLTGATVIDAPASTTTYTVTGTDGNGCTANTTTTVTVNPPPTITVSATPASICIGNSTTLTASGAASYTWMPGSLSGSTVVDSPVATTTYTVTGDDGTGCTNTETVTVTVNPLPVVTASSSPAAICAGDNTTLTAGGATTYTWMPGSLSGSPVVDAPASTTTYTVTGTDANGCTNTANTTVTVNTAPSVGVTASAMIICAGSSSMLTANGANTYSWMPGAMTGTSVIVSPASTTTYTVTGTDINGCTATATITITVNPPPVVSLSGASSYCEFSSTVLTASAPGASTYQWYLNGVQIAGETNPNYTASAPGIYNCMIADAMGCADTAATGLSLTENPAPTVSFGASPSLAVCTGSSLTLSGTGATTYTWSGGIFDATAFTPAVSGDYTVTGTDALGCTNTAVASVTVIPVPTVSAIATPGSTVCAESSVTLNGSGASTYVWSGGVSDGLPFTISSTTTYTVTGTDVNGCTDTETITITVNPIPTVTFTATPGTTVCQGTAVTLNGSGASTYSWTGGVSDGVPFTPAATSSYTVTGTDGNGCQNQATVTITVNPNPTVGYTASPGTTICAGSSVTLDGTGTTSYSWSGGIFNGVPFTPASTTTYTVTGTNVAGCTGTATVTITVNPLPTVGSVATPSSSVCAGSPVQLNGTGASTYTWSGGVMDGISFVPPSTQTYTVTGTDVNGCTGTSTITVTVNPSPTVGANASPGTSVCTGTSVTLSGTGATSYSWTGGISDGVPFTPASTTSYVVTGTDAFGCTNSATVTITVNPLPTVSSSAAPSTTVCQGTMVTLTGSGASSYAWSGGVSDGVPFSASVTTTYTVTGTDVNGCTGTSTQTITVNPAPTVTATASPATPVCQGSSVTLTGGGATSYSWTGGVTDGVPFTPVATNTYTVTGSDAIGCTNTNTITVVVNPLPNVSSTVLPSSTVCVGTSVTLSGTGASSYAWTGGVSDGVPFTAVSTTTYTVTGTDGNGCTNTATQTITVNPAPTITAAASPSTTVCSGTMVTLNGFGGSSYSWTGGVMDNIPFSATTTTTYTVTGTDMNGCTGTATITITVNPSPSIGATQTPAGPICAGNAVTLNGTGGMSYTWSGGVTDGVAFNPPSTNTYTVTGTGASGCTGTATITVVVNPLPTVSSTASPGTTICSGSSVTLNGTGASTYTWTGGVINNVAFTPASTNTYTVTGTDANGCTGTAMTTITVNPSPTVSSTASPATAVCAGTSVTLTGTGAAFYSWSGGVTDGVPFTPVSTQTYTVVGTAPNGCTGTATTTITVNPLPTVGTVVMPSQLVCSGTQVTLSGTGAATYVWTGGVSDGVPFAAVSSASYTVTGTDGNGCTNTATTSLTVNPNPNVSFVASPGVNICYGTEITLDGTGATTYTWSDTTVIDGNPFTPLVSDTLYVVGTDGNGCTDTATAIITVNMPPTITAAVTPNDTVCENAMITLNGSGASTYAWSHSVTNNVAFAATTTTTYTVIGTDGNGCSDTATQSVTVIPAPVVSITGNSSFCTGGSTVLSTSGGISYQWFMNGSPIPGATSSSYTATTTGVFNVWVVNASGCGDSSATGVNVTTNTVPVVTANATSTSVCEGSPVTLSGGGAVSYAWSAGVNNNVPFIPISTMTYTVIGTAANGCTDSETITVVVNSLPVVGSTASPGYTVCAGTSVTLAGTGAQTYSWTGGIIDNNAFIATATTTYTVTGSNASGCTGTATVTVTVNPNPVVTIGPDSTQCGGSVMLDAGNPGSTYSWNTGATSQTISATVTGTYTVQVMSAAGCIGRDTAMITINTQPVVALGADDTLCTTSVTLDAMNPGGTYIWQDSSTAQTFNATVSGTYYVEVTMPGGCVSSDTVMITLNTPPTVTVSLPIDTVCLNGGAIMLGGETPTGGTWSGPAVVGNTFDPMISGIGTFGVTYMYTDTNGCSGSAIDSIMVDPCLAIGQPEIAVLDFNAYPNPNNGEFNLTISGASSATVMIYNAEGQLVKSENAFEGEVLSVSMEASGMYFVTITSEDGMQVTKRVVVTR